jgi:hypothetical protein
MVSEETFSLAVVAPALFLGTVLYCYSIWCFGRALRHPATGIEPSPLWLWQSDRLSPAGLQYRRRGTKALLGFIAVILGVALLSFVLRVPVVHRGG